MKGHFFYRLTVGILTFVIVSLSVFSVAHQAKALPVEVVADAPFSISKILQAAKDAFIKVGKTTFVSSLRSLVNKFAYDTATYIGSGGAGQKPVYFTKEFGPWLRDQAFNVGGQFIEEFAQTPEGSFNNTYNICSPDLSVSIRIALGLTDFVNETGGIPQSRCNLKTIYQSGRDQIELYTQGDYLKNLALTAFDPASTDVGAALTLFDQIKVKTAEESEALKLYRQENQGWIPKTTLISKEATSPQGTDKAKLEQARELQTQNFFTQTGDILVDAANIFLNQLALSAFNKLIDNLSKNNNSSSSGGANNYYGQGSTGGITDVSRQNQTILQAQFNERSDYDILSQLSSCPNENKPGPTNCVITTQFAQAISDRITIAEAINLRIIDPSKRLGYSGQGGELSYTDGYPYRSLIILRKYRILPVGWEVAAQYIKDNAAATKDITLGDLINCFSTSDSYIGMNGLEGEWCRGLIDPNWVLKVPKQYCGMEGYGPEILQDQVVPSSVGYCTNTDDTNCDGRGSTSAECATNYVTCFKETDCSGYTGFEKCNFTFAKEHQITRNDTYCADEQSCIKENANGSCAYYGYCTEEKRRWSFSQSEDNSCQPLQNTCQNFRNDAGQEANFLENTLDYGNCDANQVGCKQYALTGPYDAVTKKIDWDDTGDQAYFNKNVSSCDASGEGCRQFIRTEDDLDTNLIPDGSFENSTCIDNNHDTICDIDPIDTHGPDVYTLPAPNNRWYIIVNDPGVEAGIVNTKADDGTQSLFVRGSGGVFSQQADTALGYPERSFLPTGFIMEEGHYYTLSARVFVQTGAAFAGFTALGANHIQSTVTNAWQTLVITYYKPYGTTQPDTFFVAGRALSEVYIDSIKLTAGRPDTLYNEYGSVNVLYEKLMPKYLEASCLQVGRGGVGDRLKPNAADECKKFVLKCADTEVGCKSYTSLDSGIAVTAKSKVSDICPGTCLGYNTFVQQPNAFNGRQAAYFIPSTAQTCGAESVGCTAFTNLDKLDQGGEAIEYYTSLRQCMKPDPIDCGQYYTWEGSDESGYQLKVFSLKKAGGVGRGDEPASTLTVAIESALCNAAIFQKSPTEPGYNYDCRQFYAQDGNVSYHLYEKTISCSDDCHPYRREVTSQSACTAGNGTWDTVQSRCLYYAIPGEGKTCGAASVGCQEYTGNIAGNTRNVFNPSVITFENASALTEGWTPGFRSAGSLDLGGHSLLLENAFLGSTSTLKYIGTQVARNKSYNISFLAKNAPINTSILEIYFVNDRNEEAHFTVNSNLVNGDWRQYSFNLSSLDHEVSPIPLDGSIGGERIAIKAQEAIYIDNIRITEIPNRYYLIRNSWVTPTECDQDFSGAASAGYMLGCSQYRTPDNSIYNLRSFSELCDDAAAGCEAMIDTQNSSDFKKAIVNDDNYNNLPDPTDGNGACDPGERGCILTPADSILNVINDPTKRCGQESKGCQRMGIARSYNNLPIFTDVYVNNDPDQYNTTICKEKAVGCSKWTSPEGDAYFKDPGDEVCEWRLQSGSPNTYNWYKKKIKQCGGVLTGDVCSQDSDCSTGVTCQLVDLDIACPTTPHKTLGEGGTNNKVFQPSNWAGLCQKTQAGCTEFVDPVSSFNINVVRNSSYQLTTGGGGADYWEVLNDPTPGLGGVAVQPVTLDVNTTYILKGNTLCTGGTDCIDADDVYINNCVMNGTGGTTVIYQLDPADNAFKPRTQRYSDFTSGWNRSLQFYIAPSLVSNPNSTASCDLWRKNTSAGDTVELRQAVVAYQLRQNLDKQTPNGIANFNKGFILFNQRSQNGANKLGLQFNADATGDGGVDGKTPDIAPPPRNANVLIKVQPDRTCSKWLDCTSYIPDVNDPTKETCLEVGLCDSLDSEGRCNNVIKPTINSNQNIKNFGGPAAIANLTGYSKVGYHQNLTVRGGLYKVSTLGDYYNFANMTQAGDTINIANGDFEKVNEDGSSPAWTELSGSLKIYVQPSEIQGKALTPFHEVRNSNRGSTGYLPPVGSGIGLVEASGAVTQTHTLDMKPGKYYVISAYIYNKGGEAEIVLTSVGSPAKQIIKTVGDPQNQWLHKTAVFKTPPGTDYNIELHASAGGEAYFDNVIIESGLNIRCQDTNGNPTTCSETDSWYAPSTCRLYPTEDALACEKTDSNNITHKGLKGYCMEYDPKFPDTCLLWYPLDKIASDSTEEGLGLTLPSSMYYCLETQAECIGAPFSIVSPQFNSTSIPGYNVAANTNWTYNDYSLNHYYNPNSGGTGTGGPDKPSYTCTKVAAITSADKKYWRTRVVDNSSYKIDQKAASKIFFNAYAGNEVTTVYNATNLFGHFQSFNDNALKRYIQAPDLGAGGIPYISDANLTCRGYLHLHQDGGDNCNVHDRANMGYWDNCTVTNIVRPTYGCNRCGYCPFNPTDSGVSARADRQPTGWLVQDQDAGETDSGGTNYTENNITCTSDARFTYNGTKSTDPQIELLSSIFVETDDIYVRNGNQYDPTGTDLSVPTRMCGTGGTTSYPGYCTGNPALPCTSDPGCSNVGKGVCFMRRTPITSSGSFNYATDYCFIPPKVYDFTINGFSSQLAVTDGSKEVAFAFNTKTDPDQLPLKTLQIDLGFNDTATTNKIIDFPVGNYGDALRHLKTIITYSQIYPLNNSKCEDPNVTVAGTGVTCGVKPCCVIRPKVLISDNWGLCNGSPCGTLFGSYLRVDR